LGAPRDDGAARLGEAAEAANLAVELTASALPESESINAWPDAAAEAAFLGEARERGETVVARPVEVVDEADTGRLPPLDELVKRLSPEVRVTLDDLFRAKFTTVRRVPKKALKG
jgi:hypothetical protein